MNLIIDFGNTHGKVGLFEKDELIKVLNPVELNQLPSIEKEYNPKNCIVSSSSVAPLAITEQIKTNTLTLSNKTPLPFKIGYKTPGTLGLDRIAGVAGAYFKYNGANSLVIDLGTCITYDVLIDNVYLGGGISPGMHMRLKALNTFTANLPLVEPREEAPLVGDTTANSILSGTINGITAEIEQIIRMYSDKYGSLQIIICGGDSIFFEKRLKASIFAAPELVLRGLNGILQYNVS